MGAAHDPQPPGGPGVEVGRAKRIRGGTRPFQGVPLAEGTQPRYAPGSDHRDITEEPMTRYLFRNVNLLDPAQDELLGGHEVLVEGELVRGCRTGPSRPATPP